VQGAVLALAVRQLNINFFSVLADIATAPARLVATADVSSVIPGVQVLIRRIIRFK
jgi:hypothetical protein